MLEKGAKLGLFFRINKAPYTEITIGKIDRIGEEEFKIWIDKPPAEYRSRPIELLAIDDGKEYEVETWQDKDNPRNWGLILRRIR